jgi:hypothetical protein
MFIELVEAKSVPLLNDNYVLEWKVIIACAHGERIEADRPAGLNVSKRVMSGGLQQ